MMRSAPSLFIVDEPLVVGYGDEKAFVEATALALDNLIPPLLSGKNPDQQGVVVLLPKELGEASISALS